MISISMFIYHISIQLTRKLYYHKMNNIRLTPENVFDYVDHEIIFKTNGTHVVRKINGISTTGKTIHVDYPELNNNLQIVTRNVYAIISSKK